MKQASLRWASRSMTAQTDPPRHRSESQSESLRQQRAEVGSLSLPLKNDTADTSGKDENRLRDLLEGDDAERRGAHAASRHVDQGSATQDDHSPGDGARRG